VTRSLTVLSLLACISVTATVQRAAALTCDPNPTPVTTINRCDTVRKHGGEVKGEDFQFQGQTYRLWSATQTYIQLFSVSCKDACGNTVNVIDEVDWDCVAPQEIAAIGSNIPNSLHPVATNPSCPAEQGISNASQDFQKYIDTVSNHEAIKPAGMPAPQQGINYWDGDGN
jgi:hypothetical protein